MPRRTMTTTEVARLRGYTTADGAVEQPHRDQASEWCRRRGVRAVSRTVGGEMQWDAADVEREHAKPAGAGRGNRTPRTEAQREAARRNITRAHQSKEQQ